MTRIPSRVAGLSAGFLGRNAGEGFWRTGESSDGQVEAVPKGHPAIALLLHAILLFHFLVIFHAIEPS